MTASEGREKKPHGYFFINLKEIGECDERHRTIRAIGYGGKAVAKADRPLMAIASLINEAMPFLRYSSEEAMREDLERFRKFVNGLSATPTKQPPAKKKAKTK